MSRCRKNLWKGLRFPGSKGNMKEVRLSKKAKKEKKRPGKKLAVAKPCIFAQQSASHAANAAKKGWRTPFSFKITPRRPAGLVPRRVERSDRRRPPCAANGAAGPVRRQLGEKAGLFRQADAPRDKMFRGAFWVCLRRQCGYSAATVAACFCLLSFFSLSTP